MRNGKCPKCDSSEVYAASCEDGLRAGIKAAGGQLLLNIHRDKGGLFGDEFTVRNLQAYVCRDCGYTEQYVRDMTDLSKLADADNWDKVEG